MATDRETQLLSDATAAGITSPRELANFMAQVTHESRDLTRLEEGFRYTKNIAQIPVRSALREGPEALEAARIEALQGKPEKLAELMYGGRMGNDEPGDGYKYRGRGYIQLTGKDNYERAGEALGLDLKNHPELAAEPRNASRIATWFWNERVPDAAQEDVRAATRAVNGGLNGLADREQRFEKWQRTLTPEVMERLASGEVGLPVQPGSPRRDAATPAAMSDGVLRQGERGDEVRAMQETLAKLGYRDAQGRELVPDAHFGARTEDALRAFQRDHGLKDDGVAGPKTLEALKIGERQPLISDASHPGNPMYRQALSQLEQLGPQAGFRNQQEMQNAAASLAFEAKVSGLSRIDHVALGTNGQGLFAVQGRLDDPGHHRVYADREAAAQQPVERSSQQWQQDAQQQQSQQAQAQQREPARMSM